jgi:hypothetical protein
VLLAAALLATTVSCPAGMLRDGAYDACVPLWVVGYLSTPWREQDKEWEFLDREHKLDLAIYSWLIYSGSEGGEATHYTAKAVSLGPAILPEVQRRIEGAAEDPVVLACLGILDLYAKWFHAKAMTALSLVAVRAKVETLTGDQRIIAREYVRRIETEMAKR